MAFQPVLNTAEIVITYLQNNEQLQNVLQAEKAGGYVLADLVVLADVVDFVVGNDWLPLQTSDCTYQLTTVRGLEFENDQEVTNSDSAGLGGVAVAGLPGNATFSVKKESGQTGRSARGRMYWIGMTRNDLSANENIMNAADALAIRDAVEAMRLGIESSVWSPVILSRFTNGAKRAFGLTFPWISSVNVNTNVDSQRRRLFN